MSSASFTNVIYKMYLEIIFLIYILAKWVGIKLPTIVDMSSKQTKPIHYDVMGALKVKPTIYFNINSKSLRKHRATFSYK